MLQLGNYNYRSTAPFNVDVVARDREARFAGSSRRDREASYWFAGLSRRDREARSAGSSLRLICVMHVWGFDHRS